MATKRKAKRMTRAQYDAALAKEVQQFRRDDLRRVLEELTKSALARLLEVDVRTVRRWAEGTREIDGPAGVVLALIAIDPETIVPMLRDDVHPK